MSNCDSDSDLCFYVSAAGAAAKVKSLSHFSFFK